MYNYVLIGAGGTGTHLLRPLLTYLSTKHKEEEWEFLIVDGDTVEPQNLERQLFTSMDIFRKKAMAAAREVNLPNVKAFCEYLSEQNINLIIPNETIVLIAADNYAVRGLIQQHCMTLDDVVVINGGNERDTGSCQLWVRKDGRNITPQLSFLHPEILSGTDDRNVPSCMEIATTNGGEQLIATNMASAMWMLMALMKYHTEISWTEIQFNLIDGTSYGVDNRERRGWVV